MDKERIIKLADNGFITQVSDVEDLTPLSEMDLINAGYITQVGIFDGEDDTEDENVAENTPTKPEVEPITEPEVEPITEPEDEPITEPEDPIEDESDAPVVDEGEDE